MGYCIPPILYVAVGYVFLLLFVCRITRGKGNNDVFFRGGRNSPWWAVSFGMLGASVSGVSFVSVPGMVLSSGMSYLQMCFGFVLGYVVVSFLLLPLYYRLNLTTIYTYLNMRFGNTAYRIGSLFFFVSKLLGASIRLYLVCLVLQSVCFDAYYIPFWITVTSFVFFIWFYTRQGGIRTLVWSDCLQTFVLLFAIGVIIWKLYITIGLNSSELIRIIINDDMSKIFVFDDTKSKYYFWKLFVGGIFTVIVMTGLDQDMMQKNLTCKTLKESQLNMCINGLLYAPVNLLFLCVGMMIVIYCHLNGIGIPEYSDELLPMVCGKGYLGTMAMLSFLLGIVAAAFSSADSAMTSLTTSICIDILRKPNDERMRKLVHPVVGLMFVICIMMIRALNSTNVIDAVYTICGYTYGPLLGLFSFGIFTHRNLRSSWVLPVCLLSPVSCYFIQYIVLRTTGYVFGYELLLCNGLFTFLGLFASSTKFGTDNAGGNGYIQTLCANPSGWIVGDK